MVRGAITEGTVGTLSSGRLVVVERVTPYAAYLHSLPDQHLSSMGDDVRYSVGAAKSIATSPYVSIDKVPLEQLTERNRKFIANGFKLGADDVAPPKPVVPTKATPSAQPGNVKRGGERRLEGVVANDAKYLDKRMEIVHLAILGMPEKPMLEQVITEVLKHEKFQAASAHRAARWYTNELIKLGYVKYVE